MRFDYRTNHYPHLHHSQLPQISSLKRIRCHPKVIEFYKKIDATHISPSLSDDASSISTESDISIEKEERKLKAKVVRKTDANSHFPNIKKNDIRSYFGGGSNQPFAMYASTNEIQAFHDNGRSFRRETVTRLGRHAR